MEPPCAALRVYRKRFDTLAAGPWTGTTSLRRGDIRTLSSRPGAKGTWPLGTGCSPIERSTRCANGRRCRPSSRASGLHAPAHRARCTRPTCDSASRTRVGKSRGQFFGVAAQSTPEADHRGSRPSPEGAEARSRHPGHARCRLASPRVPRTPMPSKWTRRFRRSRRRTSARGGWSSSVFRRPHAGPGLRRPSRHLARDRESRDRAHAEAWLFLAGRMPPRRPTHPRSPRRSFRRLPLFADT